MPSAYLTNDELAAYGLPDTTSAADIARASASVDAYLKRVEGLVWAPDCNGLPCYMAALEPSYTSALPIALTAGQAATITFPRAAAGMSSILGEVLIVDRASANLVEALTITAFNAQTGTITLSAPTKNHAQGAMLDMGMVISEERAVAAKRSVTRVTQFPVARLLSGVGRYSYGRRSDQVAGLYNDVNLLAAVQTFGGPPQWMPFDIRSADLRADTGQVWVPAGMLLALYSDVCLRYVAGYPAAGVPAAIKQATANIINNSASGDYAPPNFKVAQAGGSKFERFSDSQLDSDTRGLLEPFRKKLFF